MKVLFVALVAVLLTVIPPPPCDGEAGPGDAATARSVGPSRTAPIPPRAKRAIGGSEFGRRTTGLAGRTRQRMATTEILSGNVPAFLRDLRPIEMVASPDSAAAVGSLVVWVMPDYLAIGSDEDFLRMPLTRPSIAEVAAAFGMAIPTTRIVDAVYAQCERRYRPQPMPPGPQMRSSAYYLEHQKMIQQQSVGWPLRSLVAGDKKDIVLSKRLVPRPDRIAIYGWHRSEGDPIQPLSTVHGAGYADYSHGVRLVDEIVRVDGEERSLYEVLADPALAPLLSDEGVIADAPRLVTGRTEPIASRADPRAASRGG